LHSRSPFPVIKPVKQARSPRDIRRCSAETRGRGERFFLNDDQRHRDPLGAGRRLSSELFMECTDRGAARFPEIRGCDPSRGLAISHPFLCRIRHIVCQEESVRPRA
jgi:hypothetical protein